MALTDSTTFYGDDAKGFFSTAFNEGNAKNEMTLLPGVKSKLKMASYELGSMIQAEACAWNNSGEGTLAQKTFEVCDLMIQLAFCTTVWEQNYLSLQLKPGSVDAQIPDTFEKYLLDQIAKKLAQDIDDLIINGDTEGSPADTCDGLIKKLLADADVVDVNNTTVTASNVVVELNKIKTATPANIREKADYVILVSDNIFAALKDALAATAFWGINPTSGIDFRNELIWTGYRVVKSTTLPADTAIAFSKANVFFIVDMASDPNEILMLNQRNVTGVREIRVTTSFKVGVNYMFGTEIVLYS